MRREVEEHFRRCVAELPFYHRVKVLHLRDAELPRTAPAR